MKEINPTINKVNLWTAVILIIAAIVNFVGIMIILPLSRQSGAAGTAHSTLVITVSDAVTREPLPGATVCIPEINSYFTTGEDGRTPEIEVPVLKNDNFDGVYPRGFGDITVLTYHEGYIDYILFYVMTVENTTRNLNISLFQNADGNDAVHSIIESPDNAWVREVVKKYKK